MDNASSDKNGEQMRYIKMLHEVRTADITTLESLVCKSLCCGSHILFKPQSRLTFISFCLPSAQRARRSIDAAERDSFVPHQ